MRFQYPCDGLSKSAPAMEIYQVCFMLLLWGGVFIIPFYVTQQMLSLEFTCLFAAIFLGIGGVGALMNGSDVILDDDGIAWVRGNIVWRRYDWRQIKRVRIRTFPMFSSNWAFAMDRAVARYSFDVRDAPREATFRDTITVRETIQGIGEFVALANQYIDRYRIEIVDMRSGTAVRRDRL